MPKVSVVIPAHNAAPWIGETLDSIVASRIADEAMDLIVVDDGSTDDTANIAEQRLQASRFKHQLVRQPQSGVSAARNAGWQLASSEWILFLDADDLVHPLLVSALLNATSPAADVFYAPWTHYRLTASGWKADPGAVSPAIGTCAVLDLLQNEHFVHAGSYVVRRAIANAAAGFDRRLEPIEDINFLIRLAMNGARFQRVEGDEALFFYRLHTASSLSRSNPRRFIEGCLGNAELVERHLRARGPIEPPAIDVIARVYFEGCRYYAGRDWRRFREVAAQIRRLGVSPARYAPARLAIVFRVLGHERAERLAVIYRAAKRWLPWKQR